ncbi:MAG: T9SS type A sorting domain-containing protein, partial [Bacteroidota bacterium]
FNWRILARTVKVDDLYSIVIESVFFERSTEFLIAPNPSSGDLQLIATNFYDDQSILEVFDQSGRRIYRGLLELDSGYAQLQASDLRIGAPGNYFLKITGSRGSHTLKFMMID